MRSNKLVFRIPLFLSSSLIISFRQASSTQLRPLSLITQNLKENCCYPTTDQASRQPSARNLASMSSLSSLHSHACCTVPPVQSEGYKEKGKFITVNGKKTCRPFPPAASMFNLTLPQMQPARRTRRRPFSSSLTSLASIRRPSRVLTFLRMATRRARTRSSSPTSSMASRQISLGIRQTMMRRARS